MKKLGQEPAYPYTYHYIKDYKDNVQVNQGISERLYIATEAMKAIITHNGFYWQGDGTLENLNGVLPEHAAQLAFQYADALLKEELND